VLEQRAKEKKEHESLAVVAYEDECHHQVEEGEDVAD